MSTTSTPTPTAPPVQQKGLKWIETTDQSEKAQFPQPQPTYSPSSARERLTMAMKNPLVPLSMLATVAALTMGIRANLKGDRFRQQMMMRYRVGFQGFTILMLVGGLAAAQMLIKDD